MIFFHKNPFLVWIFTRPLFSFFFSSFPFLANMRKLAPPKKKRASDSVVGIQVNEKKKKRKRKEKEKEKDKGSVLGEGGRWGGWRVTRHCTWSPL
jgi:hypothetical protein